MLATKVMAPHVPHITLSHIAMCCATIVRCKKANQHPLDACRWFAQCITQERADRSVDGGDWDGRVLMCEEMPEDTEGYDDWAIGHTRRLLDSSAGGYGGYGGYGGSRDMGGYGDYGGSRGMGGYGGAYGDATRELPTAIVSGSYGADVWFADTGDCDTCLDIYQQCADSDTIVACCSEGLNCVKKNW